MLFVTVFLVILAIIFVVQGARQGNKDMVIMGVVFLIAALGTGAITYIALSAF